MRDSADPGATGSVGVWGFAAVEAQARLPCETALAELLLADAESGLAAVGLWGFAAEEAAMIAARHAVDRRFVRH